MQQCIVRGAARDQHKMLTDLTSFDLANETSSDLNGGSIVSETKSLDVAVCGDPLDLVRECKGGGMRRSVRSERCTI